MVNIKPGTHEDNGLTLPDNFSIAHSAMSQCACETYSTPQVLLLIFRKRTFAMKAWIKRLLRASGVLPRPTRGPSKSRRAADEARGLGQWAAAAEGYARHLRRYPSDAGIWIQLGHALKEQGRLVEAEDAYGAAVKLTPDDADLLLHYGHIKRLRGDIVTAVDLLRRSAAADPRAEVIAELSASEIRPHLTESDKFLIDDHWSKTAQIYDDLHDNGPMTLASCIRAAESHAKAKQFDSAFKVLASGKSIYGGSQSWLTALHEVIDTYFQNRSIEAQYLYADGNLTSRRSGDQIMTEATRVVASVIKSLIDQPVSVSPDVEGRVVILASMNLKQCTHYRVEQKALILESMGMPYDVFEATEVSEFMAALPGSSAAIFYRVPAVPGVIKAIQAARSQGVTTFYEIDDLIFDSENYPDPFETFQGQIDESVYQGLIYGAPLYRSAMAMCDYGIASTHPLAREMRKVVGRGEVFVVRNGLDPRNIGLDKVPSSPRLNDEKVRIFYGSATLSHNQDFHDLAGPGLCAVMAEHPDVELVIVGHLALGRMFDPFLHRIKRIELLADARSYWTLLATADINLAVVAPGLMSDCKSEIKWLEAAVVGVPSIVSATETHRQIVEDQVTGLLAANTDEWTSALRRLVANVELRRSVARQARDHALVEYSLQQGAASLARALSVCEPAPSLSRAKPRILVVNVFFPPQSIGGATRVVAGNVDDWIEDGAHQEFDFAVAAVDHEAPIPYSRRVDSYRGIPVFRVAPPLEGNIDWNPNDPNMAVWFADVLNQFKPDLVHFHCVQRLTASVLDECRRAEVPYLVTAHDGWWVSDYQFLFDENARQRWPGDEIYKGGRPGVALSETLGRLAHLREALDGAEIVTAPSRSFADLYRQAGFSKTIAVSNGSPGLSLVPRRPSSSGRVRLGHIGDTSPHKGFDLVEAALRRGKFRNLELLALSHGRPEGEVSVDLWGETPVRISGRVAQDKVADVYANLDVLLAPSACTESYGLVTREANEAGLWVVASNRGAIGEDVRIGTDGFIVDVSTPEGLFDVFQMINDDPTRFLEPAPARSKKRSARDQAAELIKLYRSLVDESRPGSGFRPSNMPDNQRKDAS